ncbi:HNH endonuclease [Paraburkholderia sp. Ac-20347]|nr:HNH endonuclease [Paraburkholderia sp. Ac-20347]
MDSFNPGEIEDARERVTRGIKVRRGQKNFREMLLAAYGGRCAITGCDIRDVLEAAHITPYLGPNTNHVTNGLLLRTDLHTLLDCDLIGIDPATRNVLLAPSLRTSADYGHLHGKSLRCASPISASPSTQALEAAVLRLGWMTEPPGSA